MHFRRTSSAWSIAAFVLALAFAYWGLRLISSVGLLQAEVATNVSAVSKLTAFEQSIRSLKSTSLDQGGKVQSLDAYRRNFTQLGADSSLDSVRPELDVINKLVVGDSAVAAMADWPEGFNARVEKAVDENKRAIQLIRGHLTVLSLDLASKWHQLNLLVGFSCFLAMMVAALLFVNQREFKARQLSEQRIRMLTGLLPICAWCKNIRDDRGQWMQLETYVSGKLEKKITHSICPQCEGKVRADAM